MRKWAIVWLAVLILSGAAWPSPALAHRIGWWGPGLFFGGLALGTELAYPYYTYPYYPYWYYAAPYAYPYSYAYPGPTVYEQIPVQSAPLVQRDVCYANGCYHLYGDGETQSWQWVWTPATPAPPPPAL
jgi:hypothetical protein